MAQDDNMAVGALQAIKSAGKLQQVKLVSINSSKEGLEAILAGEMYGSCTQSPSFEGINTARVARDVANGWPPGAALGSQSCNEGGQDERPSSFWGVVSSPSPGCLGILRD